MRIKLTKENQAYLTLCGKYGIDRETAIKIRRLAIKHDRYATLYCNRELTEQEQRKHEQIKTKLASLLPNDVKVKLEGDPRGYTTKLFFTGGEYNTWGGSESGYGVPID
jgi:hypothetical protein